jgi:hypothetical protein
VPNEWIENIRNEFVTLFHDDLRAGYCGVRTQNPQP